jgi:phospholipase C
MRIGLRLTGDPALQIKYVIYLMMENHSFDNIAGYWTFHPGIDNLANLGTSFCNAYTNPNWTAWGEPLNICAAPYEKEVPLADPDHNFAGTSYEIYQNWSPSKSDTPTMGGFIERQSEKYNQTPGQASFVIKAYNEKKTATLVEIAKNFAFFDSYVRISFPQHAEGPKRTDGRANNSTQNTRGRLTQTASSPRRARLVAMWIIPTSQLAGSTMGPVFPA